MQGRQIHKDRLRNIQYLIELMLSIVKSTKNLHFLLQNERKPIPYDKTNKYIFISQIITNRLKKLKSKINNFTKFSKIIFHHFVSLNKFHAKITKKLIDCIKQFYLYNKLKNYFPFFRILFFGLKIRIQQINPLHSIKAVMYPRSRSVFQNYQNFQAWEQMPEQSHYNLLHKLNTNLSVYESKYKKYMNLKENEFHQKLFKPYISKQNRELDSPFLPQIRQQNNSLTHNQDAIKSKILISCQKQHRNSEIFCERANNCLKLRTISFEKQKRRRLPVQRRKLSLHEVNAGEAQKIYNKQNQTAHAYQNLQCSAMKLLPLNKSHQYKQLRFRLKKAAKKRNKQFNQSSQKVGSNRNLNEQKENLFFKKHQKLPSCIKQSQYQNSVFKPNTTITNQFSDKKFYEDSVKERYNKFGR